MNDSMERYYHYTNSKNLAKIKQSGIIYPSQNMKKAGRFGQAVYFTTLTPHEHTKTEIAKNNYNNGYLRGIIEGKVDCYIEIEIQPGDVNPFSKCPAQSREVYIVRGQLWLRNFSWRCGKIEDFFSWGLTIGSPDVPYYCASVEIACGVCGITFSDSNGNYERAENMRKIHMEVHRQQTREVDGLYSSSSSGMETGCRVCGMIFSDYNGNYKWLERMKRKHMKLHEPKNIPCPIARDKCFKNPASALKHIESGACDGCKSSDKARKVIFNFLKSKKVAQNLLNPQLEYDGGKGDMMPDFPYRCNQCGKVFKNVSSLMQHQTDSKRCQDEFSRIGKYGPMSL